MEQLTMTNLPKLWQSELENCCCCSTKLFTWLFRSSMPSWKRLRNFSWTDTLWSSTVRFRSIFACSPDTSDVDASAVFNNWPQTNIM